MTVGDEPRRTCRQAWSRELTLQLPQEPGDSHVSVNANVTQER